MQKKRLSTSEVDTMTDSPRRKYESPKVTTYTEEELFNLLGPARTSYHRTPNFVTGG